MSTSLTTDASSPITARQTGILLISIMIVALCGIVYELLIGTVSSYLLGASVHQFSLTIGFFMFAMGVGSYLSRFFNTHLIEAFVYVEMALAVVGGMCSIGLFMIFPYAPWFYTAAMFGFIFLIGVLVGLEIPLLTRVLAERQGTRRSIADVMSLDYVGALVKHAYDKFNINFVGFLDENLMTMDKFSGRTWMNDICNKWHDLGFAPKAKDDGTWTGIHWSGTSHATLCTKGVLKTMREAGCSHLVYGYESFAPHVLKTIGKGATRESNLRSFFWTLEAGIRPVPNQIIGFPNEDFDSIRMNMNAWDDLGIQVRPHFATPYPGSEWFTTYRERISGQYDGNMERFIFDLGDASSISAVINPAR